MITFGASSVAVERNVSAMRAIAGLKDRIAATPTGLSCEAKPTSEDKLPVQAGIVSIGQDMTESEARAWGQANMPAGLRAAGFKVSIARTVRRPSGIEMYSVNYGKSLRLRHGR